VDFAKRKPAKLDPAMNGASGPTRGLIAVGIAATVLAVVPAAFGAATSASTGGPGGWGITPIHVLGILDLLIVAVLVLRGLDVRLVLFLGAVPLVLAAGRPASMVTKLASEMANPATVVPICSAMGFAYVLRLTECDQHLVLLLVRPLRRMRVLLVPGGIAAGYFINTTIVSQAGTAAVLGPVLIPLLRAGGLSAAAAGAVLLLGSSMGGELFNPGAVEIAKLAQLTAKPASDVVAGIRGLDFLSCGVILVAYWLMWRRLERRNGEPAAAIAPANDQPAPPEQQERRLNFAKAAVPLLPILLLLVDSMAGEYSVGRYLPGPARILAAILIGVVVAGLTSLGKSRGLAGAFFDGAGYAYTHIISLIVVASTFAAGVEMSGLIGLLIRAINAWPESALVVAPMASWFLAFVAGTGIAPAVAIMEFFVPAAGPLGLDPLRLGAVTSLAAHFGRTMSPAAAVVMVAARLSGAGPRELVRRVAGPLLIGLAVLIAAALLRVA
jgi:C4-dicarboxylate transporter, DcuC family